MPTKLSHSARATVVLLLAILVAPACSLSMQRSTAIASEQLSAGTVRLKDTIEAHYVSGDIFEPEYRAWKRALGRVATAGLALNQALRTSDGAAADVQVRAIIDLLDELIREDVIRLPAASRPAVLIVMESIRSTLMIISAVAGG